MDDDEKKTNEKAAADQCFPSTSPLRLPQPLLAFVLRFLPLDDKFTHLTHIHQSLPPLTPAACMYDSISFTRLRTAWCSSIHLQQLLATVRVVLFQDMALMQRDSLRQLNAACSSAPHDRG